MCAAPARRRLAHCGALAGLPGRQYKALLHVALSCSWTSQAPSALRAQGLLADAVSSSLMVEQAKFAMRQVCYTEGISEYLTRKFQIPPDLVVKTQALDIAEIIL